MSVDKRAERAAKAALDTERKFGFKSASSGKLAYSRNSIPTGSLLWDYTTGIAGHPANQGVEVFGPPSMGKSTIAGYSALRGAQSLGMLTGVIAVEPITQEDEEWMERQGVNMDYNIIGRPNSGEEAFAMAYDWVKDGVVDYILFDSIGAITSNKELDSDKPQAFGNSALITWGVNRLPQLLWKNNVGIMYINQIRDDTKSRIAGLVDSPGGHAAKHAFRMRTQLKPGKDRYTIKMHDGEMNKDVMVGRQVVASFKKNRVAEGLGKSARFDFYHIETEEYPFGFDVKKDIVSAAKVSGVFQGSGWISHPMFPGGKLQGVQKVYDWIEENPDKLGDIRKEVLDVMAKEESKKVAAKKRAIKSAPEKKPKSNPDGKTLPHLLDEES